MARKRVSSPELKIEKVPFAEGTSKSTALPESDLQDAASIKNPAETIPEGTTADKASKTWGKTAVKSVKSPKRTKAKKSTAATSAKAPGRATRRKTSVQSSSAEEVTSVPATKITKKKTTRATAKTKKATAKATSTTKKTSSTRRKASETSGKTLIIVESPTKARTLTKLLGSHYVVKASIGHIVDLPKSRMGIDIENHFKPEYILVKGKAAVKKELQAAAKDADTILLAADPDREGEAIAWHVAELLGIDPSGDCRIRFHEITKDAVTKAVAAPGAIDMDRVDAQQARRVLDRLVGYTLSPLLWKKINRGRLSAGRVQSVALAILCEREAEIEAFVPKDYWTIDVDVSAPDGRTYKLRVERENGKSLLTDGKSLAINTPEKVAQIESDLKNEPLTVTKFTAKKNSRKAPVPFKTSTLQQMAASRLSLSPRRTMQVAQSLFEGVSVPGRGTIGLITYMRTDSLRMAPEAIASVRKLIGERWGSRYLPAKAIIYQAGANAQDAHEAIRPTDFSLTPESLQNVLSPEQLKLYKMIWRRSVASQMSPAIVNLATLDCDCGDYGLRTQGSSVAFEGWGVVWDLDVKDTMIPPAEKGENLHVDKIISEKDQTRPPSRYTDSGLIKTLEEDGIGRPSTYATIVETLYDRRYVEREEGRKLRPTELGRTVNTFLLKHFDVNSPSPIVNVSFTSSMEKSLDEVESGDKNWVDLIEQFWKPFTEAIAEAEKAPGAPPPAPEYIGEDCPECGRPLVMKHGRFGDFIGCSGFPECHYVRPLQKKIGVPCPICGVTHGGEVIQRKSKKGRTFYGCSRYPDCNYVSWNKPAAERCPKCGGLMEYKGRARTPVCTKCGYKGGA